MRTSGATIASCAASAADLGVWAEEARARTLALVADLTDEQMRAPPYLAELNPALWEIGHVAWFQEQWVLRHAAGRAPLHAHFDALYDSAKVPHATRWTLPLPSRRETLAYLDAMKDRVLERLREPSIDERDLHFVRYTVHHEDMHQEALLQARHTLGLPAPAAIGGSAAPEDALDRVEGDVALEGGIVRLGAERDASFVFDNEKWAHDVEVAPFRIARRAVTEGEMLAFVEDGGYEQRSLWSDDGWAWRERAGATHPRDWRPADGSWERRWFDRWEALDTRRAVIDVNAYEAEAWCRWAGRRLPTEAEWERVACSGPSTSGRSLQPWGDATCTGERANVDGAVGRPASVDAFANGDGTGGCRQLAGNVWEWTATAFEPFPGFVEDAYREYSRPWFATHRVLRGGSWATRGRLLRSTLRNYYRPERRDVFAGFRTCARP